MKEHCLHILQKLCHTQLHSESVTGILVESSYSVQLCHVRGGGGGLVWGMLDHLRDCIAPMKQFS